MLLIGRNFGDEGLFFLAESLAYNQVRTYAAFVNPINSHYSLGVPPLNIAFIDKLSSAVEASFHSCFEKVTLNSSYHFFFINQNAEEVDFSANGITAAGLKALDGVLQSNVILKTLNLSGNAVGDEGAKVMPALFFSITL